jgi:hypothetical protein
MSALARQIDRVPELRLSRALWAVIALALLAATVYAAREAEAGWIALGFGLMPDIGLIAGLSRHIEKGRLHPRAVPLYNALHMLIGPAILLLITLSGVIGEWGYAAALAWATHVAVDRALGYRLRAPDGSIRS